MSFLSYFSLLFCAISSGFAFQHCATDYILPDLLHTCGALCIRIVKNVIEYGLSTQLGKLCDAKYSFETSNPYSSVAESLFIHVFFCFSYFPYLVTRFLRTCPLRTCFIYRKISLSFTIFMCKIENFFQFISSL